MPIYEYRCRDCAKRFEKIVLGARGARGIACPKCGAKRVERLVSRFATSSRGGGEDWGGDVEDDLGGGDEGFGDEDSTGGGYGLGEGDEGEGDGGGWQAGDEGGAGPALAGLGGDGGGDGEDDD